MAALAGGLRWAYLRRTQKRTAVYHEGEEGIEAKPKASSVEWGGDGGSSGRHSDPPGFDSAAEVGAVGKGPGPSLWPDADGGSAPSADSASQARYDSFVLGPGSRLPPISDRRPPRLHSDAASAVLLAASLPGPPEGGVAPSSTDNDALPLDLSAPLPADLELDLIWGESDERLGAGASGQVFKATWRQGRTAVAVKLWNSEALGEGGAGAGDTPPASLLHEIAILRRLMHPNMCAGHACGWGFIG